MAARRIRHPVFVASTTRLTTHDSVIYEPNYRWLIHFARKLEALEQIPGHEHVLVQFGVPDRYPSVLMELDFALKLKLAGISCKYDFQRGTPTPDLVAEVDSKEVDIEVASLARPADDTVGMEAMSALITIRVLRCLEDYPRNLNSLYDPVLDSA